MVDHSVFSEEALDGLNMQFSVITRKGNLCLVAYHGLDGKKHYTLKWCNKRIWETVSSLDGANNRGGGLNPVVYQSGSFDSFYLFHKKKQINRLRASRINNGLVIDSIKKQFQGGNFQSFIRKLEAFADNGVWGIELEEFIKREALTRKKKGALKEIDDCCQLCWYKFIKNCYESGKWDAVKCLGQILNLEERIHIESLGYGTQANPLRWLSTGKGMVVRGALIEPMAQLKEALQQQLEAISPINSALISLYVYYDLYARIDPFDRGVRSACCLTYVDALLAKANSDDYLFMAWPGQLCMLLEHIIACSKKLKGTFDRFSSGHYKWQQLNICMGPLMETISDKVNGDMFADSVTTMELVTLNHSLAGLLVNIDDKGGRKKIRRLIKKLGYLYKLTMNKQIALLFSGRSQVEGDCRAKEEDTA